MVPAMTATRWLLALAAVATSSPATADDVGIVRFHHGPSGELYFVRTTTPTAEPVAVWWGDRSQVLVPDTTATGDLPADRQRDLMRQAIDAWNRAGDQCDGDIELSLGEPEAGEVGFDGVNRIVFRDDRWCAPIDCDNFCGTDCPGGEECHDPDAAGLTTLCMNLRTGEILDADIEINGVDFAIGDMGASAGAGQAAELINTFTHELGHVLGLDHTCWDGEGTQPVDGDGAPVPHCRAPASDTELITEATMYPTQAAGERKKATLEQDDIDGLCAIYPPVAGCGCTGSPSSPGWLALAAVFLVTTGRRGGRRRRRRHR